MKVGDFNLADPGVFLNGIPHDYFALLRREAPVHWEPRGAGDGFWSISRYEDIQAIEKNTADFTNETNVVPLPLPEHTLSRDIGHTLIMTDPPRHQFLRRVIMSAFTPKAIARINARIQVLVTEAIDAVIEQGRCDLVDLAAYVPIEVVADMLGVPQQDRAQMFAWSNATFGMTDPEFSQRFDARKAAEEMFEYARKLGIERRATPGEDIFSTIAAAREDGEMLSDVDLGCFFLLLVTAGNETTRTQTLLGMQTLMTHPEVRARLQADRSLLPNAIEELLRFNTPLLCFGRKAQRDLVMHGIQIRAGDQLILWYCSASRDDAIFERPDELLIDRANAREHMAFGAKGAIHHCMGSMLARTELAAIFEQVLTRLPDMALAGPVARLRSNFTNGIKRMPVSFTPGSALGRPGRLYATEVEGRPADGSAAPAGCPVHHQGG
jgi:cytochrome P450